MRAFYFNSKWRRFFNNERCGLAVVTIALRVVVVFVGGWVAAAHAQSLAVNLQADRINEEDEGGKNGRVLEASGDVQASFKKFVLCADRIRYWRDHEMLRLYDGVQIKHPQLNVQAAHGEYSFATSEGEAYHFETTTPERQIYLRGEKLQFKNTAISARNVVVTSCARDEEFWHLSAAHVQENEAEETVELENVWLNILGTPMLYLPHAEVYYGSANRSGFLVPQVQYNDNNRWGVEVPYYLALSEQYDWTITPAWHYDGGVNVGNEFRFVTAHGEGVVEANQVAFADPNPGRQAAAVTYHKDRWQWTLRTEHVSHDDYFQNYGEDTEEKSTRNIPRYQAAVAYEGEQWRAAARVEAFETLADDLPAPHRLLPQIDLTHWGSYGDDIWWEQQWQYSYFKQQASGAADADANAGEGARLNWHGRVQQYWTTPLATFTPGIGAGMIKYHNQRHHEDDAYFVPYGILNMQKNWVGNVLPLTDADDASAGARSGVADYLSFRAALVYSARRTQNAAPVYDTTTRQDLLDDFYEANRFAGGDRFSDDRFLVYGVQYRRLLPNNDDLIYAGIGQRYYLQDSKVGIAGETRPTRGLGNVLAESQMVIDDNWKVKLDAEWDSEHKKVARFYADVRGQLARNRLLQVGALIDDEKSINAGGATRLSDSLEVAAQSTYSITDDDFSEMEIVLRLGAPEACWRLHVAVENTRINEREDDWSFQLGLELVELGSVGGHYDTMLDALR